MYKQEELLKDINILIEINNQLVKKGSKDSLESKYYYITKDISNYVKSIITHNQKDLIEQLKIKSNIKLIDVFAGSGIFTLIFSKYLLELIIEKNIMVNDFGILLNDKMYGNSSIINWKTIEKNFNDIYNNLSSKSYIKLTNYDISSYDNQYINYFNNNTLVIAVANPMFIAIGRGKEHYKPISFSNEDLYIENNGVKRLLNNFISKVDFFIYLTKQPSSNLTISTHKNTTIYLNDYEGFTITDTDKKRLEIFYPNEKLKLENENFWKFTSSQKENFNTILVFKKGNDVVSYYKYVYNKIYDARDQRQLKSKINKLKDNLKSITEDDVILKYDKLKDQL